MGFLMVCSTPVTKIFKKFGLPSVRSPPPPSFIARYLTPPPGRPQGTGKQVATGSGRHGACRSTCMPPPPTLTALRVRRRDHAPRCHQRMSCHVACRVGQQAMPCAEKPPCHRARGVLRPACGQKHVSCSQVSAAPRACAGTVAAFSQCRAARRACAENALAVLLLCHCIMEPMARHR